MTGPLCPNKIKSRDIEGFEPEPDPKPAPEGEQEDDDDE